MYSLVWKGLCTKSEVKAQVLHGQTKGGSTASARTDPLVAVPTVPASLGGA